MHCPLSVHTHRPESGSHVWLPQDTEPESQLSKQYAWLSSVWPVHASPRSACVHTAGSSSQSTTQMRRPTTSEHVCPSPHSSSLSHCPGTQKPATQSML